MTEMQQSRIMFLRSQQQVFRPVPNNYQHSLFATSYICANSSLLSP